MTTWIPGQYKYDKASCGCPASMVRAGKHMAVTGTDGFTADCPAQPEPTEADELLWEARKEAERDAEAAYDAAMARYYD